MEAEGHSVALETLGLEELVAVRLRREGRFRDNGEPFEYVVRLLRPADVQDLLALHEEILDSLPDPLLLYRRDADFFLECVTEGCVTGAFHGSRLMAYAALWVPGLDRLNYGRDLGLSGEELEAVGHLAGSAVAPPYRGNRIQRELVALRNCYAGRSGHHHMCGEVVPTNIISIINHLSQGFYLTGHRIDEFGDRCFILHADLRREPRRVEGDRTVEAPVRDVDRYMELVDGGRWGYEVRKVDGEYRLRYGRFV
ncbi:MAG: hypothetical protein R3266_08640 [Gemmatimonadota bacterium]|nr:hypothetical protein [Gemmatimonadota bacterium]